MRFTLHSKYRQLLTLTPSIALYGYDGVGEYLAGVVML